MSLPIPVRSPRARTALVAAGALAFSVLAAVPAAAAVTTFNNSSAAVTYSSGWLQSSGSPGYAFGDAHYTNVAGATASFRFSGTSVVLTGGRNADHGRADVKICDANGASCGGTTMIDTYSATVQTRQVLFSAAGLASGTHTLVVTVRSDTSGSGRYTDIDFFTVDDGQSSVAGTRYVDNAPGSNCTNAGPGTSQAQPWCDFGPVQNRALAPGAQLLLARGRVWSGPLVLTGSGTSGNWITLGSYGTGNNPVIQGANQASDRTVVVQNPDYWRIRDLELRNAGMGLVVQYTTAGHHGLDIRNLWAHDLDGIMHAKPRQADFPDLQNSAAITVASSGAPLQAPGQSVLTGLTVRDNHVANAAGVYLMSDPMVNGLPDSAPSTHRDVDITHNNFSRSKTPILAVEAALDPVIANNWIDCGGHVYEPQGTTCFFVSKVDGSVIQNNVVMNMNDTDSHDQSGIDFEYKVRDSLVRGNFFKDNAGAGVEFLQLGRAGDYSTGGVVEGNTFYNNGGGGTEGQTGHIAVHAPNATGPQIAIRHNDHQVSPTGFISDVNENPNLTNVTQTGNAAVSSMYPAAWHFGATQGNHGWRWQSYSGSGSWTDLPGYSAQPSRWTGTGGASVDAFTLTPGVGSGQWVARTWVAPQSGTVRINGQAAKDDGSATAGQVLIERNSSIIWPSSGGPYATIAAGDRKGVNSRVTTTVNAGDVIRFVVHANGAAGGAVSWTPSISYV
ncbi:right-handed parallel beta-helix repeat-containing protein [Lentzea sp. JNUCC 0626]|uniref:right-handed parallel beta-helix repeat-containing protein n=1 Tax=Lentzea sp. JNUCC 0626 TaxID=3367513 RepID=UPI0037486E4D